MMTTNGNAINGITMSRPGRSMSVRSLFVNVSWGCITPTPTRSVPTMLPCCARWAARRRRGRWKRALMACNQCIVGLSIQCIAVIRYGLINRARTRSPRHLLVEVREDARPRLFVGSHRFLVQEARVGQS